MSEDFRVTETIDGFDRIVEISPGFDKRHTDPVRNYGIGGMGFRFILRGPKGAVQFCILSAVYPIHVARELSEERSGFRNGSPFMGSDVGYHSPMPRYEGQTPMGKCDILPSGDCYYDGSSLAADEFLPEFITGGLPAVWKMLRERYGDLFAEAQQ